MLRLPYTANTGFLPSTRLAAIIAEFGKLKIALKNFCMSSGDTAYKWNFTKRFTPELYKIHTSGLEINCAFCENLVRSSCHRYCMKCRAGTYIHCSPLLPGMLHYYDPSKTGGENETTPWYYKNVCTNFKRLNKKNYLRNFIIPLSSATIENFELLEGLSSGLSAGEKPCRICASVDYEIYKTCSRHKGFDKNTPCELIAPLMTSRYCS